MAGIQENRGFGYRGYKNGRQSKFPKPHNLRDAAIKYFEWVEQNPIQGADKILASGESVPVFKPRAMSINAMAIYLGVSPTTLSKMRTNKASDDEWMDVFSWIDGVMHSQKFEYAAVNEMNASIIMRDLGLHEKTEAETKITISRKSYKDAD